VDLMKDIQQNEKETKKSNENLKQTMKEENE
jgi:hypothetical protein